MRKAYWQAAPRCGWRAHARCICALLCALGGLLLCAAPGVWAAEEPDLRLPPIGTDELPAFAEVSQPPELAGGADSAGSTQPRDAKAAIPDDPQQRRIVIPAELLSQQFPPPPEVALQLGPDEFEVDGGFVYDKNVVRVQGGGVRLYIKSLLPGTEIVVHADSALYNTKTGEAELSGGVRLEVAGVGLLLDCDYFNYDPLMQRMRLEGAQLELPLDILPPGTFAPRPVRPQFTGHIYTPDPRFLSVKTGMAFVDYNPRRRAFELSQVKLAASSHPDPDFYLTARSLSIGQDNRVHLQGISLHLSGHKLLHLPAYTRGPRREKQLLSFGWPSVSADRDGLSWKQPLELNIGSYQASGLIDYADEYGLLLSSLVTQELAPGLRLGLRSGTRNVSDIERQRIERSDSLLSELIYDARQPLDGVQRLRLNAEYGETTATTPRQPGEAAITQVQATRLAAGASVEFEPVPLGDGVFLTAGGMASHVKYGGLDDSYSVAGGELGLVLPRPDLDFNNYIVYRYRSTSGEARMSFDEVRREELDFAAQFRFEPRWRQTLHGIYDLDLSRFDTLELGAMRRQRSYELGMYYDFARDSAGLELGLLVD